MHFLADENCDYRLVHRLRDIGHDVATIHERLPGASDEQVTKLALHEKRLLLTEDRDFGQLVFSSAAVSPGVIYLRFPANAREAMTIVVANLIATKGNELSGRFVVVQPHRVRILHPQRSAISR